MIFNGEVSTKPSYKLVSQFCQSAQEKKLCPAEFGRCWQRAPADILINNGSLRHIEAARQVQYRRDVQSHLSRSATVVDPDTQLGLQPCSQCLLIVDARSNGHRVAQQDHFVILIGLASAGISPEATCIGRKDLLVIDPVLGKISHDRKIAVACRIIVDGVCTEWTAWGAVTNQRFPTTKSERINGEKPGAKIN